MITQIPSIPRGISNVFWDYPIIVVSETQTLVY